MSQCYFEKNGEEKPPLSVVTYYGLVVFLEVDFENVRGGCGV